MMAVHLSERSSSPANSAPTQVLFVTLIKGGSHSASGFLLLGVSEGTYLRQILFSRHLVFSSGKFFPPGFHLKIGPVDLCLQRINALLPKDSGANSEFHLPGGLWPGGHLCSYKMGAPLTPSAF